ncbi:MAG: glutathione S-transferase family protein [Arenibacterium sp.]
MTNIAQTPVLWGRGSSTNVQKVIWALQELGVAYDHIEVGGPFGQTHTAEFTGMNPNQTVPVWQTPEITLWESQAILRHLARRNGALYGADELAMANVDQWLDWFALVLWPPARLLFLQVFRDQTLPLYDPQAQEALAKTQAAVALLADQAARDTFIAGPAFSIADIAIAIGLNRIIGLDYGITLPAPLCEWHALQKSRPGFAIATKGEPEMPGHTREAA